MAADEAGAAARHREALGIAGQGGRGRSAAPSQQNAGAWGYRIR